MAATSSPGPNAFVRSVRKIYNPIGFSKGYNFTLFFIFCGAWLGFTLARFPYLNFSQFCSDGQNSGGECFHFKGAQYVGLYLHLGCILPAALLACFQFVPKIRHKVILFHRVNGYIIILLVLVSNVGALMIARNTFGGLLSTQAATGLLVILSTAAIGLAYYNVKRLQLEQHRAWMLRAFFYMGSIITLRIILITSAAISSSASTYYMALSCEKIDVGIGEVDTLAQYPECANFYNGTDLDQHAAVRADLNGGGVESTASLNMHFGMAFWLALAIHAIGVEIYLQLTPRESERLREVSYTRQLEAGFKNPGSAGLPVEKVGDSKPWISSKPQDEQVPL